MCGIAGFWGKGPPGNRPLEEIVDGMAGTLDHRGPDDSGTWKDDLAGVAFGFRRLAILELSPLGRQPMTSESGRYVLVFNGEIFNFPVLRSELESFGHCFRGRSDTEVILAAVEEWGIPESFRRFNGMFAIALWDNAKHTLTLARDHLGIKPLYYGVSGGTLLFASELKAIRAYPDFQPEMDPDVLALYFRHGFIPGPYSIYKGIRKLQPGCFVTFRNPAEWVEVSTYWLLKNVVEQSLADPYSGSEEDAVGELDSLLRDSVRRRMISDVPLGAFLSGGIDSSLIVALMQEQSNRPVRTFTIAFGEERFNEAPHAARVAQHLRTDHTELKATPNEALELLPLLPSMYDEPFADVSQIPTHLVSRMTRNYVKTCLSGDGGDEVFGGYTHYWDLPAMRRKMEDIVPPFARAVAGEAAFWTGSRLSRVCHPLFRRIGSSLVARSDYLLAGCEFDFVRIHNSYWRTGKEIRFEHACTYESGIPGVFPQGLDYAEKLMYYDTRVGLPDDMLTKVDRASSWVNLEVRVPLLDPRVVEFAWRIPTRWKVRGFGQGKWLLRKVLHRYVPPEMVDRPKKGFGVPMAAWLREPLRDWAESLLTPECLADSGLEAKPVRSAWNDLLRSDCEWDLRMWIVLMYQAWREQWAP